MPIRYAPRCQQCGALYLVGSSTACQRCLHRKLRGPRRRRPHLRCDCGRQAVAVVLVSLRLDEHTLVDERMPLCRRCLKWERELQEELDYRGIGHH